MQAIFFLLLSLSTYFSLLLANTTLIEHPTRAHESDYEALLAIKDRISDDPNSALASWSNNNSLHLCQWEGVTCGRRHKRVVYLILSSRNLVGTLSPFVGNMTFLRILDLSNNLFHGNIPHQISHLSRLQVLFLVKNSFEGEIPSNLSSCLHLTTLNLGNNQLVGRIPTDLAMLPNLILFVLTQNNISGNLRDIGIGNMSSSLQVLYLDENQLQGSIPDDFARLKGLRYLSLSYNLLSGTIPESIYNLSSLKQLYLSGTRIIGHLPQDLGLRLPQLQGLFLANCSLVGELPTSLSNLTKLDYLELSYNNFVGRFSLNGNNHPNLGCLHLAGAFSLGGEARDLSFLESLTNCTKLKQLTLDGNSFTGSMYDSILNLSNTLVVLTLSSNHISGQVPLGLGRFVNLTHLSFGDNHFTGLIPTDIGDLESIEILDFSYNNFSGEIPSSLGNLNRVSELSLQYNSLEGSLPKSLGKCQNLQSLYLQSNKLSGGLPAELFLASSLINLDIGQNNFQGSLPDEVVKLQKLVKLVVSQNRFSGDIPSTLGNCTSLTVLDLGRNLFVGSIPESLSPLESIQILDLSCNNLSGEIPWSFSTWKDVSRLNLSFNNLEGEVPTNGVFGNTRIVSVVGNSKLCGGVRALHLPSCPPRRKSKRRSLVTIMIISVGCVLLVVLSLALCLLWLCPRKRKDASLGLDDIKPFLKVSYQLLSRATNGFSPSNLIGVGGFGTVYKGILHQDGTELAVAVKVLNLQREGACKSFIAECTTLRNIRHRNLVRIITACSSIDTQCNDFKALVYEYMPQGSLDSWLHSNLVTGEQSSDNQSCSLSLFQRASAAIDVGCALEYLHTGCATPIIHCDLKPTNILLDDDMIAHVGDFGLSMFSSMVNPTSTTQVRGTIGYAAPEYGLGSKVSPKGDIYSFGIVILEMMTSKKPTDPMFNDGLNLHDFAKSALPDRVMEIIDQNMLGNADELSSRSGAHAKEIECIKSVIMVGVQCSLELPRERMSIKNALNELNSALQYLL